MPKKRTPLDNRGGLNRQIQEERTMPIPKVKEKRVGRAHRESDTLEIALVFFVVFLRFAYFVGEELS